MELSSGKRHKKLFSLTIIIIVITRIRFPLRRLRSASFYVSIYLFSGLSFAAASEFIADAQV